MAAGLPVVAVDAGALTELIQTGVNGYLYKSGDTKAIADNICSILGRPELAKKMTVKASEFVCKHDIRATVLSFIKLYEKCAKSPFQANVIIDQQLKYKMA